jgi:Mg-chelatase subunit ChlD
MKIYRIVYFFAFILLLPACEEPKVEGNFGKISGTLAHMEGNLEGILVKLFEKNSKAPNAKLGENLLVTETHTDEKGHFQMDRLPPKDYILKIFPNNNHTIQMNVSVNADKTRELNIDVKEYLRKNMATVRGSVHEKDNQSPLEGIRIKLQYLDKRDSVRETRTNKKGRFSFVGVEEGRYRIISQDQMHKQYKSSFRVEDQEPVDFVITLPLKKGILRGQILDATSDNEPLVNQKIEIHQNQNKIGESYTNKGGLFKFDQLPYGEYTLVCNTKTYTKYKKAVSVKDPEVFQKISLRYEVAVALQSVEVNNATAQSANFLVNLAFLGMDPSSANISKNNFHISNTTVNGTSLKFDVLDLSTTAHNNNYSYSAMLLLDQSGSMNSTDPKDVRLLGSRLFFEKTTKRDQVGLAAFASTGYLKNEPYTVYENGLCNTPKVLYDDLDSLKNKVGGGTPLYESTLAMTNRVAVNGTKQTKSVVVFTDGEGYGDLEATINNAKNKNIKLFTIGLGKGTNRQVLSRMAEETGGYSVWGENTKHIAAAFAHLDDLLRQNKTIYHLTCNVQSSSDYFPGTLSFNLKFTQNGKITKVPVTIIIRKDQLQNTKNNMRKTNEQENNLRLYEKVYYPDN